MREKLSSSVVMKPFKNVFLPDHSQHDQQETILRRMLMVFTSTSNTHGTVSPTVPCSSQYRNTHGVTVRGVPQQTWHVLTKRSLREPKLGPWASIYTSVHVTSGSNPHTRHRSSYRTVLFTVPQHPRYRRIHGTVLYTVLYILQHRGHYSTRLSTNQLLVPTDY